MATERSSYPLADVVVWAISPALVAGMVAGLALFLLEVCYQGQYELRLQWILSFFVVGAVLIARVSMMTEIAKRSWVYGIVLGVLTLVALQVLVEYPRGSTVAALSPVINTCVLGLVWWMAHKLTWDCTHIDEESDDEGQGLLEAAGLQERTRPGLPADAMAVQTNDAPGLTGWIQRYQRYRAKKRRQRTLGVWVVYFGLGTLPVFGLGQALIPAGDEGRRQYAFWLMALYVACGLGLLLTTRFLGLRRYLRGKHVEMPPTMAGVWLTSGVAVIGVLLVVGALLPRPRAEYRLIDFTSLGEKSDSRASRYAQKDGGAGKDKGKPGEQADKDGKDGSAKDKGEPGGKDKNAGGDKGKEKDKGGSGKDKDKGTDGSSAKAEKDKQNTPKGDKPGDAPKEAASDDGSTSSPQSWVKNWLDRIWPVVKWIVFGLLGLLAAGLALWFALKHLAQFTSWAKALVAWWQNLWASLFGGKPEAAGEAAEEPAEAVRLPKPFAAYPNPFDSGSADRWTTAEAARYTFAALEAWTNDRGLGRRPDETPSEFARRLGEEMPALEAALPPFLALYLRATYAPGEPSAAGKEVVRQFWQRLEQAAESPLSAA